MNSSLIDKILSTPKAVLATVLETSGHTYAKAGARALFVADEPYPLYGNIGSVCMDQEVLRNGRMALDDGVPRRIRIDTSGEHDAEIGYGTYCGGVMDVLLEPVTEANRDVYRELARHLAQRRRVYLVHDTRTGDVWIDVEPPSEADGCIIDRIAPPVVLWLFGATPLTRRVAACLDESEFEPHVVDWRTERLERFDAVRPEHRHLELPAPDPDAFVLVASHDYYRDKTTLVGVLEAGCTFVGMVSSGTRWRRMRDELLSEGADPERVRRVSCPAGLDIAAHGDAEIAVSVAAEIVQWKNR